MVLALIAAVLPGYHRESIELLITGTLEDQPVLRSDCGLRNVLLRQSVHVHRRRSCAHEMALGP